VPASQQVLVPGHELRIQLGEESQGLGRCRVGLVDVPGCSGVHWRLDDAGGGLCRSVRVGGAVPESRSGKVGVFAHLGVELDVGHSTVGPLALEQRGQLGTGAGRFDMSPPDRDEGGVPAPLMRILRWRRQCGDAGPVALEDGDGRLSQAGSVEASGRVGVRIGHAIGLTDLLSGCHSATPGSGRLVAFWRKYASSAAIGGVSGRHEWARALATGYVTSAR